MSLAHQHARVGVAALLRLSFVEPRRDRGRWLAAHGSTGLITLKRISFTNNHRTDNVAAAWWLWEKSKLAAVIVISWT